MAEFTPSFEAIPMTIKRGDDFAGDVLWPVPAEHLPCVPGDWGSRAQIRDTEDSPTIITTFITQHSAETISTIEYLVVSLSLAAATTAEDIVFAGETGVWDIEITDPDGFIKTPGGGPVMLNKDVTK